MLKLPLTAESLNKVKQNIKQIAESYQVKRFPVGQIGNIPGSRRLVESTYWPVEQAVDFFVKEGAIILTRSPQRGEDELEIVRDDYFNISFAKLELPITFSIDERIKVDVTIMAALYAVIYDVENRMRFFLEEKLLAKYGTNYLSSLPADVQNSISREKSNPRWYINESRTRELNYTQFSDLAKIVGISGLLADNKLKADLLDKLKYLNEARTRIDHNNMVPSEDVQKVKDYAEQIQRLIAQL